MGKKASCI